MSTIGIKLDNPVGLAVLDVDKHYGTNQWYITRINVPLAHRNKGYGTELLDLLMEEADREKASLWLEIQPSDGLSYNELEAWYLRHGFEGFMMYRRRYVKKP